ncbi:MAG: twin-arginine translocase TatA/TatE family subunit [Acidimicrobiales bacterium]
MFNVGGPEVVVILLVLLVVLGPDQLPKAMRTFGNVMAEIRKVSGGFQAEMRKAIESIDEPSSSSDGGGAPAPRPLATTPEEADVTEVVARNPATAAGPVGGTDAGAVDPDGGPAAVDPADRASG